MIQGSCLCAKVRFEIDQNRANIYQCFCSLCRKVTGSQSNSAFIVQLESFRWITTPSSISSYEKESGFRTDFCNTCGCPVPNQLRSKPYAWVPAGLIDSGLEGTLTHQICLADRTNWTQLPHVQSVRQEYATPDIDEFIHAILSVDNGGSDDVVP